MEFMVRDNTFLTMKSFGFISTFEESAKLWLQPFIPGLVSPVTKNLHPSSNAHHHITGLDKQNRSGQDVSVRTIDAAWRLGSPPLQRQNPPEHIRAKWPLQMRAVINHARTHTHPHTDTRVYMQARGHVDEVTHNHLLLSLVSKLSPPAVNQKAGIKK